MSSIGFKSLNVLRGMFTQAWHPLLIEVMVWAVMRYSNNLIMITSAYRDGDPGVHGTKKLRGFDMRSKTFDKPQEIADDINQHWVYDPDRPEIKVCVYHDVGKGKHFHIQVHPNTKYLGG